MHSARLHSHVERSAWGSFRTARSRCRAFSTRRETTCSTASPRTLHDHRHTLAYKESTDTMPDGGHSYCSRRSSQVDPGRMDITGRYSYRCWYKPNSNRRWQNPPHRRRRFRCSTEKGWCDYARPGRSRSNDDCMFTFEYTPSCRDGAKQPNISIPKFRRRTTAGAS